MRPKIQHDALVSRRFPRAIIMKDRQNLTAASIGSVQHGVNFLKTYAILLSRNIYFPSKYLFRGPHIGDFFSLPKIKKNSSKIWQFVANIPYFPQKKFGVYPLF